ncbi:nucleotidyl transferase AbiEii/AbiGii toxin family protein [Patescibacteria group bacterium]|nr:nucleotidyl transferase AbiEii/AbiGii toxin family protein [Patescibacteria group bacterium]
MLIDDLKIVIDQNKGKNSLYLRNLLKEILQIYTLNFVYTSVYADKFLFKGGTCLRFCFDLPRLSEDLDFDIKDFPDFSLEKFCKEMEKYFVGKLQYRDFSFKVAGNKREIFLRFPVLDKIGLVSNSSESNTLFLRIDLSPTDSENYKEEISLKTIHDFSFVIKRYSLEDLFASKIAAVLLRTFRKGKDDLITFKGRDYYDLIWFLEKGIKPNYERSKDIAGINSKNEILEKLDEKVDLVKENYLKEDLLPLFKEARSVNGFIANFKQLYKEKRGLLR